MNLPKIFHDHESFIRYSLIGISGVAIDYISFLTLFNIFGVNVLLANFCSTSLGITNNFILNRSFNFKKYDLALLRFVFFYATGVVGILLSSMLLRTFYGYAGFNANLVKAASLVVVVIVQYTLNRNLAFRTFRTKETNSLQIIYRWLRKYWVEAVAVSSSALMFFAATSYLFSPDEIDNMLGAKLILSGELPYKDFFSHHMPGMYFISIPIYLASLDNIFYFRLVFNILSFTALTGLFLKVRVHTGRWLAASLLLLMALSHIVFWRHLALAESVISLIFAAGFALWFLTDYRERFLEGKFLWTTAFMLFFVFWLGLAYVYVLALTYLCLVIVLYKHSRTLRALLRPLAIFAFPYLLFGTYLLLTASLRPFLFQNFTFNAEYYAPYFGDMGNNPLTMAWDIFIQSLRQIIDVLRGPWTSSNLQAFAVLVSYLSLPFMLLYRRRYLESFFCLMILGFVNSRVGLFGPPAIATGFGSVSQHALVYRTLAFVFLISALRLAHQTRRHSWATSQRLFTAVGVSAVIVIVFGLVPRLDSAVRTAAKPIDTTSILTYTRGSPSAHLRAINEVTLPNDKIWIGPFDFVSQLHAKPKRATNYTFFIAWHNDCPKCRQELENQLRAEQPKFIIWYGSYNLQESDKDRPAHFIENLLSESYTRLKGDWRVGNIYVRIDDKDQVKQDLRARGYRVE